jgi:hypothetical protein
MSSTHLLIREIQELVELDAAERERAERALLLEVSGDLGVGDFGVLYTTQTIQAIR